MASPSRARPLLAAFAVLLASCAVAGDDTDLIVGKKDTGIKDGAVGDGSITGDAASPDGATPDSGPTVDTGKSPDSGAVDTAIPDTTPIDLDTGTPDTGTPDTTPLDTGTPDTGTPDTTPLDTGTADTTPPDTGVGVSFIFPLATDTATILYTPYFWNVGDAYQGSRKTTLASATSFSSSVSITNSLTCGSLTVDVSLNAKKIGTMTITAGVTPVPANFTFPAVAGPTYVVRYAATKTVESGCGSLTFTMGVSNVTLK